jgi:hypothetical protein
MILLNFAHDMLPLKAGNITTTQPSSFSAMIMYLNMGPSQLQFTFYSVQLGYMIGQSSTSCYKSVSARRPPGKYQETIQTITG